MSQSTITASVKNLYFYQVFRSIKIPTLLFLLLFCGVATGQSYLYSQDQTAGEGTSTFYLLVGEQFSQLTFSSLTDTNIDNSEENTFGTAKNDTSTQRSISVILQRARLAGHHLKIRKLIFPSHFFL